MVPRTESGTFLPTAREDAPAHLGALVDAARGDELRGREPLEIDALEGRRALGGRQVRARGLLGVTRPLAGLRRAAREPSGFGRRRADRLAG